MIDVYLKENLIKNFKKNFYSDLTCFILFCFVLWNQAQRWEEWIRIINEIWLGRNKATIALPPTVLRSTGNSSC